MKARWPFRAALGFVIGYQMIGVPFQVRWPL